MNHSMIAGTLALGMLAGALRAQPQPGQPAPEFAIDKSWNGGPKAFADMKGKAVMLEFFATW